MNTPMRIVDDDNPTDDSAMGNGFHTSHVADLTICHSGTFAFFTPSDGVTLDASLRRGLEILQTVDSRGDVIDDHPARC
ncbi:hypothetical protein [Nesterenkonia aerolata]|uniref:Uncharacterized protein n=1 Tax=Nesterenkonia aerolata TaxID=3074079 RepID=A0ABU2DRH7_9MICC|nr:hypothetical protein [Nesterenkonia sp. LY-0111]MDR8018925.1 hypothetical protein [Nesterenkonia sp. LY-0111]